MDGDNTVAMEANSGIGIGVDAEVTEVVGIDAEVEEVDAEAIAMSGTADNIILIGMPGAGKSTAGIVLAKILNYPFVDVDLVIQQRFDKTLQRLIDTLGPLGFIEIENEVLLSIDPEHTIISTGGSAVYSHEAMEHLSQIGTIVYLKVDLPSLEQRLVDFDERGVVMRREGIMGLKDLYDERIPLYEKYAEITVDVSDLGITEAARAIAKALELSSV